MGLFKIKTALVGLTSIFAATTLFADQVVDNTFDDNLHEMELYWYYYDDNAGVGPNDRPQIDNTLTPTVIGVPFDDSLRQNTAADDHTVKVYTFTTDESVGEPCATMPFVMGDEWTASYGNATPYCAIGAMLAKDGESIDLTGATAISFKIKSRVQELSITFKAQIKTIDDYSTSKKLGDTFNGDEFAYHTSSATAVPGEWTEYVVDIADLAQPGWLPATSDIKMAFDITEVTKLAWEVGGEEGLSDTLDLADVEIIGLDWVSPTVWTDEAAAPPAGKCLFADFETNPKNESPLGTYWYAYNDAEIGGTSVVLEDYATVNETTNRLNLVLSEGNGSDGVGTAPVLGYELGEAVDQEGVSVAGFVGVGCNLYDSTAATYWDAEAAGATGIYFEYYTEGNDKYVVLELSDMNDVGDIDNPDRRDSRGSGIVYYRNFPATNGVWRKVLIPFSELIVHDDWEGYNEIPLDLNNLAKIQWKIQGAAETQGIVAVDNVAFAGVDDEDWKEFDPSSILMNRSNALKTNGISALYANGNVQVKLNNNTALKNGTVSLVNTKGAVVRSASVAQGADHAAFSANALSAGMYFVNFNAVDANGKAIQRQTRLNVLK